MKNTNSTDRTQKYTGLTSGNKGDTHYELD
jgi:hypothetical protein